MERRDNDLVRKSINQRIGQHVPSERGSEAGSSKFLGPSRDDTGGVKPMGAFKMAFTAWSIWAVKGIVPPSLVLVCTIAAAGFSLSSVATAALTTLLSTGTRR